MRNTTTYEPLVTFADLYHAAPLVDGKVSGLPRDEPDAIRHIENTYGVAVVRDHANRPAVSMSDAYKIRDMRMEAEAELLTQYWDRVHTADVIDAWWRARLQFYRRNWLPVSRSLDSFSDPGKQYDATQTRLTERIREEEAKAGIPKWVSQRLGFPQMELVGTEDLSPTDQRDRAAWRAYVPPAPENRE